MLLNAVLDEWDLVDASDGRRFRVAGDAEPRSLREVLCGAFAHLAVAEVCEAFDDQGVTSTWRREGYVASAVSTLASSGALTRLGEGFVSRLGERAGRLSPS